MEFSAKLKELRFKKSVSQAKLAADIHISRSAVAKWENGLGLPNDESIKLLSEYFEVSIEELVPNKSNEEILVSKNKTINRQKKLIIAFIIGFCIGIFYFLFISFERMRDSLGLLGLGVICATLGMFNMRGNIATIHWYNRRKVTKENQKPYCRFVGLGTFIIGVSMIAAGIFQTVIGIEVGSFVLLGGIIAGLILILYAQIKYNRGIF